MRLTVVMYHYVRDPAHSRFPGLRGRTVEEFRGQLDYIERHYTPVSMQDVLAAVAGRTLLPSAAVLLTFDDGYREHAEIVMPLLRERGWTGAFFPPGRAIMQNVMLDVNKIHCILASIEDVEPIVEKIRTVLVSNAGAYSLDSFKEYYRRVGIPNRYDSAPVNFIKRMLQRELPAQLRAELTDSLFKEYVTDDEHSCAKEFYLSLSELQDMRRAGMYIGGHGWGHGWLNSISRDEQELDIDASLVFLQQVGTPLEEWAMAYPYGGNNDSLRQVVAGRGCTVGFTVEPAVAQLVQPLQLARLDTNDLPTVGDAPVSAFTKIALETQ